MTAGAAPGGVEATGAAPAASDTTIDATVAPSAGSRAARGDGPTRPGWGEPRYVPKRAIAHGPLGDVVEAFDTRLHRPVVLKSLRHHDAGVRARFEREVLLTARLQHPAVVPIHDSGTTAAGEPFYAMPMVSGPSMAELLDEAPDLTARLALVTHVIAATEAVAYAHSEGVIHRDLKPHNIVIGPFGETFVIDWGLAKLVDDDDIHADLPEAATRDMTMSGAVVGTPAYMAPEQARGDDATRASDVYALGALLYRVLAGASPYRGGSARDVIDQVVAGPPPPLDEAAPGAPAELIAIARRAMARDPADRYPSAHQLVVDLRRFQTGQLVGAHRYSAGQLLARWLRRNRTAVTVGALLVVALAVTAGLSVRRIVREQAAADAARARAERGEARAEAGRLELLARLVERTVETDPTSALALIRTQAEETGRWGEARVRAAAAVNRGVAERVFGEGGPPLASVRFAPDGRAVAVAGSDGMVRVWNVDGGAPVELRGHTGDAIGVAYLGDRRLASAGADGTLRIWNLDDGVGRVVAGPGPRLTSFAVSGDGRWIAGGIADGSILLFDTGGDALRTLRGHDWFVDSLAFSPDGAVLLSGGREHVARAWDTATGRLVGERVAGERIGSVRAVAGRLIHTAQDGSIVAWSPDGDDGTIRLPSPVARSTAAGDDAVVVGTGDKRLWEWRLSEAAPRVLTSLPASLSTLAASPAGDVIAAGDRRGDLLLLERATGRSRRLHGHAGAVSSLAFSPDGTRVASASQDGTVRVWSVARPDTRIVMESPASFVGVFFSPDGRRLAAWGRDHRARVYDRDTGRLFELPREVISGAAMFSPDGRRVAAIGLDASTMVWEPDSGSVEVIQRHPRTSNLCDAGHCKVRFSPDGRHVVSVFASEEIEVWNTATRTARTLTGHTGKIRGLWFAPDGTLATTSEDTTVRLWDVDSGASRLLVGHRTASYTLRFSPDSRRLVTLDVDGNVRVWDVATGRGRFLPPGPWGSAYVPWFSPDGRYLAVASLDGTLWLWDARTDEVRRWRGHSGGVTRANFLPDSRVVVTSSRDGTLRLWDVASGASASLLGHDNAVNSVAIARDGAFASAGSDGTVRLWTLDVPAEPDRLAAWLDRPRLAR